MTELLDFFNNNRAELLNQVFEHILLTGVSLLLAILIAVPSGIFITRRARFSGSVLGFASILQTIPSLALLGFMIPIMGIGVKPAIFALLLYALLPILRNTYTGIQEIDAPVREAAVGMGMTDWQVLMRVELPLAVPVIFAGIRTATVINVGIATLAAYIGAGGLGTFIFEGINLNNSTKILGGAIPAALLAIAFDQGLAVMQRLPARRLGWVSLSLLLLVPLLGGGYYLSQRQRPGIEAGFDPEFAGRRDGYEKLREVYDIRFEISTMSVALMYKAVKNGEVDVISGYSTDGRIQAFNLTTLEDDKNAFPPYYAAPLVRSATLDAHPALDSVLNLLAGRIDNDAMARMNYRVDHGKVPPATVARDYLDSLGLRRPDLAQGGPEITIGSKNFTEGYILNELFAQLVEGHTNLDVVKQPGLGGTKICFEALRRGDIDLYPEYTGTGLLVLLSPPDSTVNRIISNRQAVYEYVQDECREQFNLEWLKPLGFNNTYALMVREETAKEYELETIGDLRRMAR